MHKPKHFTYLRYGLLTLAAVCGLVVICGQTVWADQSNDTRSALAVSPAITEQVLTPGSPSKAVIRVTNITRVPLPIKSSIKNLILQETLIPAANKATYDASAWFTVDPADFIIQPSQSKDITITILPPAAATPGGHYATVYFQPLIPTEALTPDTAYLSARVGVLAFLIVKGNITEQASLTKLSVPRVQQFGPVQMHLPVTNSGNVHLMPQGSLTVRDFRGKVVKSLPLATGLILPKSVKTYDIKWDNHGRLGYYTAQAELTYGVDRQTIHTPAVGFWIVPWLPIVLAVAFITTLIWFVFRTRRRWATAWKVLRGAQD